MLKVITDLKDYICQIQFQVDIGEIDAEKYGLFMFLEQKEVIRDFVYDLEDALLVLRSEI